MLDLALAWPLHQKTVASVIVGVTKPEQLLANCQAITTKIPQHVLNELNAATIGLKNAMGSDLDLWQGGANSRCLKKLEIRQAGNSGLHVSTLSLGTWQFGCKGSDDYWETEYTQKMANDMVNAASSHGITYFDTAEAYAGGASEK